MKVKYREEGHRFLWTDLTGSNWLSPRRSTEGAELRPVPGLPTIHCASVSEAGTAMWPLSFPVKAARLLSFAGWSVPRAFDITGHRSFRLGLWCQYFSTFLLRPASVAFIKLLTSAFTHGGLPEKEGARLCWAMSLQEARLSMPVTPQLPDPQAQAACLGDWFPAAVRIATPSVVFGSVNPSSARPQLYWYTHQGSRFSNSALWFPQLLWDA